MHETKAKVERLHNMKHTLIGWTETELGKGVECVHAEELGDAIDMIKDLAEAEEKLWKACYYKKIIEAMDKAEEKEELYKTMAMMDDDLAYDRMGYNPNRGVSGRYTSSGGDRSGGHTGRMGYPMDNRMMPHDPDTMPMHGNEDMRYGKPYNDYKIYRRNYTSSKSMEDKAEMDRHAMEHVHDSIDTVKDIWKEADPELKRKMKADFTKLLGDMN